MISGYILFCGSSQLTQCLTQRIYACTGAEGDEAKNIPKGAALFLYNTDSDKLLGPFTAANEGASRMETGAWTSVIDEHSASANVKLEWEELRIVEKASEQITFLKNRRGCKITLRQTQTLLDELREAPLFASENKQA